MAGTNAANAPSAIASSLARRVLVGTHPGRTLARVVVLLAAAYAVFGHLLIPVRGVGPSMSPTIHDGQFGLINRLAFWAGAPGRGDIVALEVAGGRVVYIKRIVALPGERVRIEGGTVIVDDVVLEEPYVRRRNGSWNVTELQLGAGEYLVIGDNRAMPQRNHDFGKAKRQRMIGRVISW